MRRRTGGKTIRKGSGIGNLPTRIRFRSRGPRYGVLGVEFRTREVRDEEDEMVGSLAYGFSGGSRPIVGLGMLSRGVVDSEKERNFGEDATNKVRRQGLGKVVCV